MKHKHLIILIFFFFNLYSQKNHNAKISNFEELRQSPLLVMIKSDKNDAIKELENKILKTKNEKKRQELKEDLENQKEKILSFNRSWMNSVEKYWKFNEEIIFKTQEEIQELYKKGESKYTVLLINDFKAYRSSNTSFLDSYGCDVICYSNIQNINKIKNYDYFFILQDVGLYGEELKENREVIFKMNLSFMQLHMNEIEKRKDEKFTFSDYAISLKEKNCEKLKDAEVLIPKDRLYKMAVKNPNKSFNKGTVKVVTNNFLFDAIKEEKDVLLAIPILHSFYRGTGLYHKIIFNANSFEIISSTNRPTGINEFLRIDLNAVSKCD